MGPKFTIPSITDEQIPDITMVLKNKGWNSSVKYIFFTALKQNSL